MILALTTFPLYADLNLDINDEPQDHYRWMENDSDRLADWILDQSDNAEERLGALPWREPILQRLEQINANPTLLWIGRMVDESARQFYSRMTPEFPYWRFFIKKPLENEQLLIDPPVGYGLAFSEPSPDGKYVVYGLAENGSEFSVLRIRHVDSNTDLTETMMRVRSPNIIWKADNRSFFYSRLPSVEENPDPTNLLNSKIYLHQLNTDFARDEMVFGSGMDGLSEISPDDDLLVDTTFDASWLVASVSPSISGYSSSIYVSHEAELKGNKTKWRKIIDKREQVDSYLLLSDQLYLAKRNAESGYTIFRLSLNDQDATPQRLYDWSGGDLVSLNASADSLYLIYHSLGKCHFVRIPFIAPDQVEIIPQPVDGEVGPVYTDVNSHHVLFRMQSWITEPKIFRYSPGSDKVEETDLLTSSDVDFSPYVVENKQVRARDGTLVPLTIIRAADIELNGNHPLWLNGYGTYGVSITPSYDPSLLVWLEQGGIYAIAHVRGGGELGPDWHKSGKGRNKINSITDFIDCADYLVEHHYTKPDYLVASGSSAGGILVGMATVLRPELFSAIAIDAGIVNTTRLALIPIGLMNQEEFGTAATVAGLQHLYSIDPYANLRHGVNYPATLLAIGLDDNRVSVWQSAKYIARLQEIEKVNPALLIAYSDAGHFLGSNESLADKISFFLWQIKYKQGVL